MVKGVEKGYILKIENFVKINVHIPLKWPIFKIKAKLQCLYEEIENFNIISFNNP